MGAAQHPTVEPRVGPAALRALAGSWRILDSPAADGATNMAVDSLLLDDARRAGLATLRLYAWSRPTLSLGRHERARGRFSAPRLAAAGVDVVRRPTGGRALLHHREVTYAVAAPALAGAGTLRLRYEIVTRFLADALARLGVAADAARPRGPTLRPGRGVCFAEPNAGELVVGGAKLVASAQVQVDGAFLQHGSILLGDDQARIADFADGTDTLVVPRAATVSAAAGRAVEAAELRRALLDCFLESFERDGVTSPPVLESLPGRAGELGPHRARFLDGSWTWHR